MAETESGLRYWLMRGALCMERIGHSLDRGFDGPSADRDAELAHIQRMLGEDGDVLLMPYFMFDRLDGEGTLDWMARAEAELLAEAAALEP